MGAALLLTRRLFGIVVENAHVGGDRGLQREGHWRRDDRKRDFEATVRGARRKDIVSAQLNERLGYDRPATECCRVVERRQELKIDGPESEKDRQFLIDKRSN